MSKADAGAEADGWLDAAPANPMAAALEGDLFWSRVRMKADKSGRFWAASTGVAFT